MITAKKTSIQWKFSQKFITILVKSWTKLTLKLRRRTMMAKYMQRQTTKFKKDLKNLRKRGYDLSLLNDVVELLANGETLPEKYRDHALAGNKIGYRDCHIKGDWVLIYKIDKNVLTLILSETGTHSDILE
jgi:mRNA interferase YafQ